MTPLGKTCSGLCLGIFVFLFGTALDLPQQTYLGVSIINLRGNFGKSQADIVVTNTSAITISRWALSIETIGKIGSALGRLEITGLSLAPGHSYTNSVTLADIHPTLVQSYKVELLDARDPSGSPISNIGAKLNTYTILEATPNFPTDQEEADYIAALLERNPRLAMQHLTEACARTNTSAQFLLAACLERGKGVPGNFPHAIQIYRKLAYEGYKPAQVRMAIHLRGVYETNPIPAIAVEASKWIHLNKSDFYLTYEDDIQTLGPTNFQVGIYQAQRWKPILQPGPVYYTNTSSRAPAKTR